MASVGTRTIITYKLVAHQKYLKWFFVNLKFEFIMNGRRKCVSGEEGV